MIQHRYTYHRYKIRLKLLIQTGWSVWISIKRTSISRSFLFSPIAVINLAIPLLSIHHLSNDLENRANPSSRVHNKGLKRKKKKKKKKRRKGNPRRKNRDYTNGISICRAVSHVHSLAQTFTIYKLSSNIYQRCTAPSSRLAFIFWCATTRPAKGTVNSEFSFVSCDGESSWNKEEQYG